MSDDQLWHDGEAAVRKSLEQAKVTVKELRHTSMAKVHVFSVVAGDDSAFLATAANNTVYLSTQAHSDDHAGAIFKAEKVHDRSELGANDILLIVHAFGSVPAEVKDAVDQGTVGMGSLDKYPPKLARTNDGLTVEVFASRPGRYGAEAVPKDHLYKGTLSVSKTYKVSWKVDSVDLPRKP